MNIEVEMFVTVADDGQTYVSGGSDVEPRRKKHSIRQKIQPFLSKVQILDNPLPQFPYPCI